MYETFYEPNEQDLRAYAECLKHPRGPYHLMKFEWEIKLISGTFKQAVRILRSNPKCHLEDYDGKTYDLQECEEILNNP